LKRDYDSTTKKDKNLRERNSFNSESNRHSFNSGRNKIKPFSDGYNRKAKHRNKASIHDFNNNQKKDKDNEEEDLSSLGKKRQREDDDFFKEPLSTNGFHKNNNLSNKESENANSGNIGSEDNEEQSNQREERNENIPNEIPLLSEVNPRSSTSSIQLPKKQSVKKYKKDLEIVSAYKYFYDSSVKENPKEDQSRLKESTIPVVSILGNNKSAFNEKQNKEQKENPQPLNLFDNQNKKEENSPSKDSAIVPNQFRQNSSLFGNTSSNMFNTEGLNKENKEEGKLMENKIFPGLFGNKTEEKKEEKKESKSMFENISNKSEDKPINPIFASDFMKEKEKSSGPTLFELANKNGRNNSFLGKDIQSSKITFGIDNSQNEETSKPMGLFNLGNQGEKKENNAGIFAPLTGGSNLFAEKKEETENKNPFSLFGDKPNENKENNEERKEEPKLSLFEGNKEEKKEEPKLSLFEERKEERKEEPKNISESTPPQTRSLFDNIKPPTQDNIPKNCLFGNTSTTNLFGQGENKPNENPTQEENKNLSSSQIFAKANEKMKELNNQTETTPNLFNNTQNQQPQSNQEMSIDSKPPFTKDTNPFLNMNKNVPIDKVFSSGAGKTFMNLNNMDPNTPNFFNNPMTNVESPYPGSKDNEKIVNQMFSGNTNGTQLFNNFGNNNNPGGLFQGIGNQMNNQPGGLFGLNQDNQQQNIFNMNNQQNQQSLFSQTPNNIQQNSIFPENQGLKDKPQTQDQGSLFSLGNYSFSDPNKNPFIPQTQGQSLFTGIDTQPKGNSLFGQTDQGGSSLFGGGL
ncbi:MAG: hypothetical protein MJ252_24675, partial [archaeon]|nr:hypothetical protein [archaeon]